MLVGNTRNDVLNLYFSDELTHGWQPHPMNPVVRNDPHHARPAGRVVEVDGRLHRFAQDCAPHYGTQVFAIEITELSRVAYAEKPVPEKPGCDSVRHGLELAGHASCGCPFHRRPMARGGGRQNLLMPQRRCAITRW